MPYLAAFPGGRECLRLLRLARGLRPRAEGPHAGHLGGQLLLVAGETGTQMFRALHEEGRMLVYESLTGEPIRVGEDPRYILAGRRVLEVFWGRYWVARLDSDARHKLTDTIAGLIRDGILETEPGRRHSLDDIGAAVTQAESAGKEGKVLLTPG